MQETTTTQKGSQRNMMPEIMATTALLAKADFVMAHSC
jgi:hypothetical protein